MAPSRPCQSMAYGFDTDEDCTSGLYVELGRCTGQLAGIRGAELSYLLGIPAHLDEHCSEITEEQFPSANHEAVNRLNSLVCLCGMRSLWSVGIKCDRLTFLQSFI